MAKQLLNYCILAVFLSNTLAVVESCRFTPECPKSGRALLPIPCEGYCNKYVICVEGTWHIGMCTWPLMNFDPQTRECITKSMVDCDWWQLSTVKPKRHLKVDMVGCPHRDFFKCIPPVISCVPGEQDLVANPCVCHGYGTCVNGTREWQLCDVGKNFDVNIGACLPSSMVHCGKRNASVSTANPSTADPSTADPGTANHSTANPSTANPSTFSTNTAPTKSVVHSPTTTTAARGLLPGCNFSPVCPTTGRELMAIPCRAYCAHFIECLDGSMYIRSCIPLFYFDRVTLSCSLLADCE